MNDDWMNDSNAAPAVQVITGSALETLTRSEIDVQIATAKKYPRGNLAQIKQRIRDLALMDAETAEACVYKLPPRAGGDGKPIEGPSIRLAEIVASCWGNLRQGSRVIDVGAKTLTAQGVCHDLESNVAIAKECRRGITTKHGKTYGNDMINMTANAACSIALRNAVFSVVPFAMVKPIVEECRRFAVDEEQRRQEEAKQERQKGRGGSQVDTRKVALAAFVKAGAKEAEVFRVLGVSSIDDMTAEHVVNLRTLFQAIRDGATTMDEAMQREPAAERPSAIDGFFDQQEGGR